MAQSEYNIREMQQFLNMTDGLYDLVRLVDPLECREITISDGRVHFSDGCYNVWSSCQRCRTCSSYKACVSRKRDEKQEYFDGKVFNILSNPVTLIMDNGDRLPCVIEFITSHTATEDERIVLNDRAAEAEEPALLLDTLTGLLNWDGFHQRAGQFLAAHAGEPCVIVVVDIAQFKLVNSLFGREKGNEILLAIADILRPYDPARIIAGRLHADRFALCMQKESFIEESLDVELSAAQSLLEDGAFLLQISAGIYETTEDELSVAVMCDRAAMALAAGREAGKSTISHFDKSMLDDLLYQQQVTSRFESMIADGEYQIFLQPQVGGSGNVLGGEALCRLIRKDGTIIPPYRFIPILERAGLIAKLDRHVWELAVKQIKAWEGTEFKDLHISVNISALDFYYIDVPATLMKLVDDYGIDRAKLKLEITESSIMSDTEKQLARVHELRSSGFTMEIDDFGTGYSSLSMLKDIEADVLKIDMAFLRETKNRDRSYHVLHSIIQMAERLGTTTITEGVETVEQVKMLEEMGCHMFQGFYFAKPMPIDEFEAFVRECRQKDGDED